MKTRFPLLLFVAISFLLQNVSFAQVPSLGTASSFALFAANGAISNAGPSSVTGDIGSNLGIITGMGSITLNGAVHQGDPLSVTAATDVAVAYSYLSTLGGSALGDYPDLGGQILTPGVYRTTTAASITGTLTLDAQGDPNALFIFRIGGAFTTASSTTVRVINSPNLCNVYWQIAGQVNLGTSTFFTGTIVSNGAIYLHTGSILLGRALSVAGGIFLDTSTVFNSCGPCVAPKASVTAQPTCIVTTGTITATAPFLFSCVGRSFTVTGTNPVAAPITNATGIFTGLAPGNYNVTTALAEHCLEPHYGEGIPPGGCISPAISLTVNAVPGAPASPTASVTMQPDCIVSTGTITVTAPAPGAGITYTVTGTNPVVAPDTNATGIFAGLAPGIYDVTTSLAGCISPAISLTVNAVPGAPASPTASVTTQPTCTVSTGTITVTVPAPGAGITYTVTGTNPVVAPITNATGIFTGLAPGIYDVTTSLAGCTSAPIQLTVNVVPEVPAAPAASVTTQPTCILSTGTITVTVPAPGAGITYTVTGTNPVVAPVTSATGIFAGLAPGIYIVTAKSADGCISAGISVTINAPANPTAPVIGTITQPTCAVPTGSVEITGLPSGNWTINPGAITGSTTSTIISGLAPGTYSGTVTNEAGCTSAVSANVIINGQTALTTVKTTSTTSYAAVGDLIHYSIMVTNSGNVTIHGITLSDPNATFTCADSPGTLLNGVNFKCAILPFTLVPCASFTCTAVHTVTQADLITGFVTNIATATGTDTYGGTITDPSDPVTVHATLCAAPVITVVNNCGSSSLSIPPGGTILWSNGATTASITVATAGTYTVTRTVNGCTSTGTGVAAPKAIPTPPLIGTITQPTCTVSTGSVVVTGLPSGNWTINPGAITGSTTSTNISGLASGIYSGTVTNAKGCTSLVSANLIINAPASTSVAQPGYFTKGMACVTWGMTNVRYTVPYVTGMTYIWSYSGAGATITGTSNSVLISFSGTAKSGILSVRASNSCGISDPRSGFITVGTTQKAGIISNADPVTIDIQSAINELNAYPNPSSGRVTFEFRISENVKATLDLSSLTGQRIARIFDADVEGGIIQTVIFDQILPPGVYLYALKWNDQMITGKLIITR